MPKSKATRRDAASTSTETLGGKPTGKRSKTAAGGGRFLRSQAPPLFMLWLCLIVFPGVAAGQNKEACNLITKADLESVTGYKFQPPQIIPAWDIHGKNKQAEQAIKDIIASQEITSSGCSYKLTPASQTQSLYGENSILKIGVRYFRTADAEGFHDKLRDAMSGGGDLWGYSQIAFPYPALFYAVSPTVLAFKETPSGTIMLQISCSLPPKSLTVVDGAQFDSDMDVKIALKILGDAGTLPGTPNEQIISSNDTLKGLNGIVVVVYLNNKLQSSDGLPDPSIIERSTEANPRLDMVNLLRQNGIKVISGNNATSPPTLRLDINTRYVSQFNGPGFVVYTIELILLQTFPVQNQKPPARFVRVSTWSASSFGVNGSDRYRDEAVGLTSQFIKAYLTANGKK
jgi:hypothetical protein